MNLRDRIDINPAHHKPVVPPPLLRLALAGIVIWGVVVAGLIKAAAVLGIF